MRIVLDGIGPPSEQIERQLHALIIAGVLAPGDRLPSVRQLARDLDLAAGTVAKAYKQLESAKLVTSRSGGGTRVAASVPGLPTALISAARRLAVSAEGHGLELEDAIGALRAVWPTSPSTDRA